jgi:uncharacterized membrane protein YfcA
VGYSLEPNVLRILQDTGSSNALSDASALYTAPALIGMLLGQWVRLRVDPATFRLMFFIGLLVLDADLALHALL